MSRWELGQSLGISAIDLGLSLTCQHLSCRFLCLRRRYKLSNVITMDRYNIPLNRVAQPEEENCIALEATASLERELSDLEPTRAETAIGHSVAPVAVVIWRLKEDPASIS